jgi:hypothetical protein
MDDRLAGVAERRAVRGDAVTEAQALALVRELRSVERLAASIQAQHLELVADEWKYGLVALDDRLRWLRYCLSLEEAGLVAEVVELEANERRTGWPELVTPASDPVIAERSPRSRTIH